MPYKGWMRNYAAMGDAKLLRCVRELHAGRGPAVDRVLSEGGLIDENLTKAVISAANKGLDVSQFGISAPTAARPDLSSYEVRECSECLKNKPHAPMDYVCTDCRALVAQAVTVEVAEDDLAAQLADRLAGR